MNTKLSFTSEERKLIYKYIHEHHSLSEVARKIGRSKNGVITEVRRNGGPWVYDPVKAQELWDKTLVESKIKRRKTMRGIRPKSMTKVIFEKVNKHESDIELLQMQIDILLETIRKLTND